MPQLRDPLDTPKKNGIRGGMWVAELAEETKGVYVSDTELADFFEVQPETVDYIRNDDEDRCNDAERAGIARNERKGKMTSAPKRKNLLLTNQNQHSKAHTRQRTNLGDNTSSRASIGINNSRPAFTSINTHQEAAERQREEGTRQRDGK